MPSRWNASLLLSLLLFADPVLAATFTWSGAGADNNWSTGANWSGGAPPGASGSVVFNATSTKDATIDANIRVLSLSIGQGYTGTITQSGSVQIGSGGYVQGGGTFTGGSRPMLIARNLTLTGGTLTSTADVLALSGSFTRTGGTFNANGGTVTLAGPAGRSLTPSGVTFHRLDIESTNETGLIGYWKLNECALRSATIANTEYAHAVRDYSGHGWDGAVTATQASPPSCSTDTPPLAYANGGSLSFNGSHSWVRVSPNLSIGSTATVAFWMKVSASLLTTQQVVLGSHTGGGLFILAQGDTNKFIFEGCGGYGGTTTDTFLNDGGWHHVALVKDGSAGTCSVYFDGALAASYTGESGPLVGSGLMIGNHGGFDVIGIQGKMADVRAYNTTLSASQVAALGAGRYPGRTGGSTVTLGAAATTTGNFNSWNGTLDVSASNYTLTVGGNWNSTNGQLNARSGLVVLNGTAQTITGSPAFATLRVGSTSAATLAGGTTVSDTLQINTGATLALSSYTFGATGATVLTYGLLQQSTGKLVHRATEFILAKSDYTHTDEVKTDGSAFFTLTDSDGNIDGTALDTVPITLTDSAGDSETIILTETSKTSGTFRGSIGAAKATPTANNGAIETAVDATMTATYTDAQDGLVNGDSSLLTPVGGMRASTGGSGGGSRRTHSPSTLPPSTTSSSGGSTAATTNEDTASPSTSNLEITIDGNSVTFPDVPTDAWFAASVATVIRNGIASGYKDAQGNLTGEFGPGNPVTYAEIAKMALEAAHANISSVDGSPANTSAKGPWSEKYIKVAEDLGLSVYTPSLDVNTPATRGAVLQTVLEALQIPVDGVATTAYRDVSASNPYAPAIITATRLGLVSGDTDANGNRTGTFRPDAPINRAEVAKIFAKLLGLGLSTPAIAPHAAAPAAETGLATWTVAADALRLRSAPALTAPQVRLLPSGIPVTVLEIIAETWAHVRLDAGTEGYVGAKWLRRAQP